MRILYYDWDEFNGRDSRDAMKRLGHQVEVLKCGQERYKVTPDVADGFERLTTVAKEQFYEWHFFGTEKEKELCITNTCKPGYMYMYY